MIQSKRDSLKEKTLQYVASFLTEGYNIVSLVYLSPKYVCILRHSRNGNQIEVIATEKYVYVYKRSHSTSTSAYKLKKRDVWK